MENMRKEPIVVALRLFYSYAHEDEALRGQLEKHLVQLRREGVISEWYDRKILPGGVRGHEIDTHLEMASIILLLVSPDFLASDYCYEKEMQRALERHGRGEACVVPIILRRCDWLHSPLKDVECLPRDGRPVLQWGDQDEFFDAITQGLREIIEQWQSAASGTATVRDMGGRRQTRQVVFPRLVDRQSRMRMLRQVRAIWVDGLLMQSLQRAAMIELHLEDRPDVLANPWRLQVQELQQAPQGLPVGTTIVEVYDRADGELLILGEPGAGKTTLLLELTRTLLERAEQDERVRMPIVFHLSSWAEKRQPLRMWLVEELWMKYQVPRKIGQGWIASDQVLPLLDGLDEVAMDARSACVEQINDYYQARLEGGNSALVVCCRSEEYVALSMRVMLQHAVSILPLSDEQITMYLELAGERVQGLREALNEDAELHDMVRQPLMLNIFTFAYEGAAAAEVPSGSTREEMQRAVFARYVEHMLKRRGRSKRWQSEEVIRWLSFLARQMRRHKQTVFAVESLQTDWLSGRWRIVYRCCVVLVVGLVSGIVLEPATELILGLTVGSVVWSAFRLVFGPIFRLVIGAAFGLVVGLVVGMNAAINPAEAIAWSWKKARSGLDVGLSLVVFIGLASGVVVGLSSRQILLGLAGGLSSGLFFGLCFGLFFGFSRKQLSERFSLSPNEGIWRSGRNSLVTGLAFGMGVGLALGLEQGLGLGLIFGLAGLLTLGLVSGLDAFVQHFILRFLFSLQGNFPYNLVAFLDEATERLLLRKVGGSYIFVHRLLLDYFAGLAGKNERSKSLK